MIPPPRKNGGSASQPGDEADQRKLPIQIISEEPKCLQDCPCAELTDPSTGNTYRLIRGGILLIRPDDTKTLLSNFQSLIEDSLGEEVDPDDELIFAVQFKGKGLRIKMTLRSFAEMQWLPLLGEDAAVSGKSGDIERLIWMTLHSSLCHQMMDQQGELQ